MVGLRYFGVCSWATVHQLQPSAQRTLCPNLMLGYAGQKGLNGKVLSFRSLLCGLRLSLSGGFEF